MSARFSRPPVPVRNARRDNLALIPGSALPFIRECQEIANTLPQHGVLIVLPTDHPVQKQTLLAVAKLLAAEGYQVRVMAAAEVRRHPRYEQSPLDLES